MNINSNEYPFSKEKIPVCQSINDLQNFIEEYSTFLFCPYLAYKDEDAWSKSTSRVYMNQVLPNFLYTPINIAKDDINTQKEFFNFIWSNPKVIAINITQPHKSNPILLQKFSNPTINIDTLIRNEKGDMVPFDLNAPSFVDWFNNEVSSFNDKTIIIIGVGGAGEPIAKKISELKPLEIILVDPIDKTNLVRDLETKVKVSYKSNIQSINQDMNKSNLIVINAAGKDGADDSSGLQEWLKYNFIKNGIFIDLRPQLEIDIVETAKKIGWQSYSGYGMNARNDYSLVTEIAKVINETPPSFENFKNLVISAS